MWGLCDQPDPSLSIPEWITTLWCREELEDDMPCDTEAYKASPVNRFRLSWYFFAPGGFLLAHHRDTEEYPHLFAYSRCVCLHAGLG